MSAQTKAKQIEEFAALIGASASDLNEARIGCDNSDETPAIGVETQEESEKLQRTYYRLLALHDLLRGVDDGLPFAGVIPDTTDKNTEVLKGIVAEYPKIRPMKPDEFAEFLASFAAPVWWPERTNCGRDLAPDDGVDIRWAYEEVVEHYACHLDNCSD